MDSRLYLVRHAKTAWSFAVGFRVNQQTKRLRLPPPATGFTVRVALIDEDVLLARPTRGLIELGGRPTSATSVKCEGHEND